MNRNHPNRSKREAALREAANELLGAAKEIDAYFPTILPLPKGVLPNERIRGLRAAIAKIEDVL